MSDENKTDPLGPVGPPPIDPNAARDQENHDDAIFHRDQVGEAANSKARKTAENNRPAVPPGKKP